MKPTLALFFIIATLTLLSSCTHVEVWERGYLSKAEMNINTDPLGSSLNKQIYFSKEASNGGNSANGGGCGCN